LKITNRGILGPEKHHVQEIRLLNRILAWDHDGIRYEADQRHAEILIESLGLTNSKGVETPGTKNSKDETGETESDKYLGDAEATAFRAAAARCNFLGLDRPDVQFAAKEISRNMAKPQECHVSALKRLGRYLKQHPRAAFKFKFQTMPKTIRVFCDSNYAGCLKTRKSTQGGIIMHGMHCIKSWSTTQAIIALSSAEAEYYGIVKAASQGLGIKSLCRDFERVVDLEVHTDASAARSIANRHGLGKVRHIDTHYLWVQQRVARGDFKVAKVWGKENPADLLTKFLDSESIKKCMCLFGIQFLSGRSAEAPQLSAVAEGSRFAVARAHVRNTKEVTKTSQVSASPIVNTHARSATASPAKRYIRALFRSASCTFPLAGLRGRAQAKGGCTLITQVSPHCLHNIFHAASVNFAAIDASD